VVDLHAEPKGSHPRPVGKACWHLGSGKQVEKRDREVGSVIIAWGLLGSGLKGIDRNRRELDYPQEDQRDRQTRSATFSASCMSLFLLLAIYSRTDISSSQHTRLACVLNPFPTCSSCLSTNRRSRATDPFALPHAPLPFVRSRACERVVEPEVISALVSSWQRHWKPGRER